MTKKVKVLAFGVVALITAFFVACTSDGPAVVITPNGEVYSEDEYNELVENGEIDEKGNVVVTDTTAKSSSSKKTSSSSTKGSSSSEKATSSSSGKASSSSDKVDSSSDEAKSSSSEKVDSSSSEPESSAAAGKETVINEDDAEFSIGTDDMETVSEDGQSELDSLKKILEKDFFCYTDDGEWMQITRENLGKYIPHYKDGKAWGNYKQFDVIFTDACKAVYTKSK